MINYSNKFFTLNGRTIQILDENLKDWNKNPDKDLLEKLSSAYISTNFQKSIQKIIERAESKNPVIGKISGIEHSINLKNTDIDIKAKPYPISYKLYDSVRHEIKRLIDNGLIVKSNSIFSSPCFPILKKKIIKYD
ncbi:Gag-Pol polyprotein [Dictyocoela muelleri]|nr:Gag-Pol polyprotein [Dictyocoela muelleri]